MIGPDLPSFDLLDLAQQRILAGEISEAMDGLVLGLRNLKSEWDAARWKRFAKEECLNHPLRNLLHQDPFTWHSFSKPRGYSGDAGLLDLIYRRVGLPPETTELGEKLYWYATNGAASRSVRARRALLARYIDESTGKHPSRVLSVACGHLREAEESQALIEGSIRELVAFDQDADSLDVINKDLTGKNVRVVHGSVRDLVAKRISLGSFDLIYAAGLYDYLIQPVARRLTSVLFNALNPGGTLLVANFMPTLPDIGYMETFMDWHLLYRTEAEMLDTGSAVPDNQVASRRTFIDEPGNVVFLEIVRAN